MSNSEQSRIGTMMRAYGQEIKPSPEMPDENTRILRAKLLLEEAIETIVKGLGVSINIDNGDEHTMITSLANLSFRANLEPNLVELADGIGDVLVVTYGAANASGINTEVVMDEIYRSNMSKVHSDGSVKRGPDGKVLKPEHYSPPDIAKVLGVK